MGVERKVLFRRRVCHSAAVTMVLAEIRRPRYHRLCPFVSTIGWVIVAWQCAEIWTITVLSMLKYTFVTLTFFPFALRRKVPGRTSLISISPEELARSVQPERHVSPVFWCPCGGSDDFAGDGAVLSSWI